MTNSNNAPWEAGSRGVCHSTGRQLQGAKPLAGAELNVRFRDRLMDRAMAELGRKQAERQSTWRSAFSLDARKRTICLRQLRP